MQTSVLSLQRCVELAMTSPKIQLSCSDGWKLEPSTVTSMPPVIGPEDGMSRWIRGCGTGDMGGGSGKNINGSGVDAKGSCRSWNCGTDMAIGEGGAVGKKVEGETPRSASARGTVLRRGCIGRGTSEASRIVGSEPPGEATEHLGDGKGTSGL